MHRFRGPCRCRAASSSSPRRQALPRIELTRADLSTVYRIADGTLSPLTGPMDEETWHDVLDHDALDYGFRHYAWTAPISFPVTDDEATAAARRPLRGARARGQHRRRAAGLQHLRLGQAEARREVLRHDAHRSSGRPHDHGRPAHQAGRRRALGAAAAGRSGVRRVHALAAPGAHADRRAALGARRSRSRRATRCTARTSTRWSPASSG